MRTTDLDVCIIYDFFETPKDFEEFIKLKKTEGYCEIKSHGLDRRFVHNKTGKMMRVRSDSFDGRVVIMK